MGGDDNALSPYDTDTPHSMELREVRIIPMGNTETLENFKFDFKSVEKCLDDQYNSGNINKSAVCDIIAMYLKGQKILYTEAKTVCEMRMNYLMLPAILITSLASILSLVLKDTDAGPTIVSSLNGVNAFLLAVISYLKLDAKAEAHRTTAYKFDKLQSNLEFSSGKNMFLDMSFDDMIKIINDTENNVRDIKETNQFILPETIRFTYPKLCNTNVFAEVKKIQNEEMLAVNRLKDVMNDLAPYISKNEAILSEDELSRKRELESKQKQITHDIIAMKDDYLMIDDHFDVEMAEHRKRSERSWNPLNCLKT